MISELFHPANMIGALRPSKIAKYLLLMGYKVDIISREKAEDFFTHPNCRMFRIQDNINSIHVKSYNVNLSCLTGLKKPIFNELRKLKRGVQSLLKAVKYKHNADKLIKEQNIVPSSYDACITTYGPLSSVLIGLSLKKRYNVKKWICDFRDPIITIESSKVLQAYYWYLQKKCIKFADSIVAVSYGCLNRICKGKYKQKSYMIPNGFSEEDLEGIHIVHKDSSVLNLTYAGALYEGKRKISVLFQVISELYHDGSIDIANICFNYAGHDFVFLKEQAEKYDLSSIIIDHGFLSRAESLALQSASDILVLATWNSKKETGVVSGKFLEYIGMRKPILALVDGDLSNSEVSCIMKKGNFGVCFEEANRSKDYPILKTYLYTQYKRFISGKNLVFDPDQSVIDRYNYKNIAQQYLELINE
ncbi:MAG: hypothetical protein QM308_06680 [Bacillota bacterium]|nr:hypothetical protein [Bacillota bacterium]